MKNEIYVRRASMYALAICLSALTACIDRHDLPADTEGGKEAVIFDFATTHDVVVKVDFGMKGNKALFEIHAENPVVGTDGVPLKKEGVKSLLKAYTDGDCAFTGKINLPVSTEKVWLYSESYGLPTCMEANVTENGIVFDLKEHLAALSDASRNVSAGVRTTRAVTADNPCNISYLGDWRFDGFPNYLLGTWHNEWAFEADYADIPDGLMNRIENVLLPGADNSKYARPADVVNIKVLQDTRLNLVFLDEMAAYRNAIGYYCYETQNPPKTKSELDALPKYIAFPNCSKVGWDAGVVGSYVPPLFPGMQLRMVYFDGRGKRSEVFPKGTTIGWFLLPDGFEVDSRGNGTLDITGKRHPIRYSDDGCNPNGARYMVSLSDKASGKTILGFEDGVAGDFKDVLFYVEADRDGAIADPDKPVTDPDDEQYPVVTGDPIEGTLAFEDLWPSQGDYDMNDAVIRYSTTFTTDKENRIVSIKDVFTPLHAGGQLKTAFGYQLDIPVSAVKSVRIDNGSSSAETVGGLETKQECAVILLFDEIRDAVAKGPVTVEIELDGSVSTDRATRKSLCNPFICPSVEGFVAGQVRKEIHLTNYAPTDLADLTSFGINDDKSTVDENGKPMGPDYYVTSDLHPFAIDLPVTNYRIPDEMMKIDLFYPDFPRWVESKGEKYKDWYKNPAR